MNKTLFTPHGALRASLLLAGYIFFLSISWYLAYELRFDFDLPLEFQKQLMQYPVWVLPLKLLFLLLFGQFAGLLSYFSVPDLRRLFFACFCGSAILLAIRFFNPTAFAPPRGGLLTAFFFSFATLSVFRVRPPLLPVRHFKPPAP